MNNFFTKKAYRTIKNDILILLKFLESEMQKESDKIHWRDVDNLCRIRQNLIKGLSLLTGSVIEKITSDLEEVRYLQKIEIHKKLRTAIMNNGFDEENIHGNQ